MARHSHQLHKKNFILSHFLCDVIRSLSDSLSMYYTYNMHVRVFIAKTTSHIVYRVGSAFFITNEIFRAFSFPAFLNFFPRNFFFILLLYSRNPIIRFSVTLELDYGIHRSRNLFRLCLVFGIWYAIIWLDFNARVRLKLNFLNLSALSWIRKNGTKTKWKIDSDFERFVIWLWRNYSGMQFIVYGLKSEKWHSYSFVHQIFLTI